MSTSPFIVSAPGKVIIFGEHSAVYSKPAIAAALSLRAYLLVEPNENSDEITLQFPDISLNCTWNKKDIPWAKLAKFVDVKAPVFTEELVPEVMEVLGDLLTNVETKFHYITCHCFLYLYANLCGESVPGMTFHVRSTLPIGAGLGSSASVAVCLASALAILGGHVAKPTIDQNAKVTHNDTRESDFINNWSLIGEKCFHGNPSGIDNAVATYGGAVMFQRMKNPNQPSVRTTMRNFPPLKLLLTNTTVPRSTAEVVAGVGVKNEKYPKTIGSVLDAMEHLAMDAYQIMARSFFGEEERQKLRELVNINHGLLVALGVSHPSLEKVKIIGDSNGIGATKLTGAGGGGCAITLVDDDVDESKIEVVMKEFEENGFETYETTLGGKGAGCLSFEDVDESTRSKIFAGKTFNGFKDRFEIENVLGVQNVTEWKFW